MQDRNKPAKSQPSFHGTLKNLAETSVRKREGSDDSKIQILRRQTHQEERVLLRGLDHLQDVRRGQTHLQGERLREGEVDQTQLANVE